MQTQAVVVLKAVCKPSLTNSLGKIHSEYHSHFIASNEGNSPAIEIEIALLDEKKNLLEGMRETALGIGEKIDFKHNLCQYTGKYYILCQYKQVSSQDKDMAYAQTWLPFRLAKASKEGEVYATPGELEFKFGILKRDKVNIFAE